MKQIRLAVLLSMFALLAGLAAAPAQSLLQPEDVANLPTVSDPRLSPDGRTVVYVQTLPRRADEERGPNRSMLWLIPATGGEARPFTSSRGRANESRVGIMGGSYGGYFSAWGATKHSAHFRAAVVNFGVSNLFSDWGDGDIPWEHRLVHWGWFPVDRPLLAVDRSPVTWTRGSRTATLIMHGEEDPRVPPAQSRELYQGLLLNEGLPLEMVLFPREGHGYREAPHRLEACRRALEWMETHLGMSPSGETPSGP